MLPGPCSTRAQILRHVIGSYRARTTRLRTLERVHGSLLIAVAGTSPRARLNQRYYKATSKMEGALCAVLFPRHK